MTRRKIFGILSIVWMIVIFAFSCRDGVQSTGDSIKTTKILDSIVGSGSYTYDYTIDHIIRKLAHMGEYFILSLFVTQYVVKNIKKVDKSYFMSWLFVSIYSITDEVHQLFVPGRSGQIKDVVIDSVGAALGIVFTLTIVGIVGIVSGRKQNE